VRLSAASVVVNRANSALWSVIAGRALTRVSGRNRYNTEF
jgi:hypothetical protein